MTTATASVPSPALPAVPAAAASQQSNNNASPQQASNTNGSQPGQAANPVVAEANAPAGHHQHHQQQQQLNAPSQPPKLEPGAPSTLVVARKRGRRRQQSMPEQPNGLDRVFVWDISGSLVRSDTMPDSNEPLEPSVLASVTDKLGVLSKRLKELTLTFCDEHLFLGELETSEQMHIDDVPSDDPQPNLHSANDDRAKGNAASNLSTESSAATEPPEQLTHHHDHIHPISYQLQEQPVEPYGAYTVPEDAFHQLPGAAPETYTSADALWLEASQQHPSHLHMPPAANYTHYTQNHHSDHHHHHHHHQQQQQQQQPQQQNIFPVDMQQQALHGHHLQQQSHQQHQNHHQQNHHQIDMQPIQVTHPADERVPTNNAGYLSFEATSVHESTGYYHQLQPTEQLSHHHEHIHPISYHQLQEPPIEAYGVYNVPDDGFHQLSGPASETYTNTDALWLEASQQHSSHLHLPPDANYTHYTQNHVSDHHQHIFHSIDIQHQQQAIHNHQLQHQHQHQQLPNHQQNHHHHQLEMQSVQVTSLADHSSPQLLHSQHQHHLQPPQQNQHKHQHQVHQQHNQQQQQHQHQQQQQHHRPESNPTTTLKTVLNTHHKQLTHKLSMRFHRIKTIYNVHRANFKNNETHLSADLHEILAEIDHYTLDWRKHALDCLRLISDSPNCTNIIVTKLPLVVAFGHLVCLGLSQFFEVDQVYSASKTSKESCIKRIKKRFGASNRCSYIIVGDKEDVEMAKRLDLPNWNTSRSDGHRQLRQLYTALKDGYLM